MADKPTQFAIYERKILDYLLDEHHPKGAGKAKFFLGLGFDRERPDVFADALLEHLTAEEAVLSMADHPLGFGLNIKVVGPIVAPKDGSRPIILSLWLRREDGVAPLVTAYPLSGRKRRGLPGDVT